MNERISSGKVITKTFDYYGKREVSVYVPVGLPQAIIFAGDGRLISQWGALLEATKIPPTMVVGVHGLENEMLRLEEYSPCFNPVRFADHEQFFVQEVRQWVEERFGLSVIKEHTAIYGASAGGELALALGLRHPDIYGVILCASPGAGYRPPEVMPELLPRTYLVAGKQEPFFLANAKRWANALKEAGAEVLFQERLGSHGDNFWQTEFLLMAAWIFQNDSSLPLNPEV